MESKDDQIQIHSLEIAHRISNWEKGHFLPLLAPVKIEGGILSSRGTGFESVGERTTSTLSGLENRTFTATPPLNPSLTSNEKYSYLCHECNVDKSLPE